MISYIEALYLIAEGRVPADWQSRQFAQRMLEKCTRNAMLCGGLREQDDEELALLEERDRR